MDMENVQDSFQLAVKNKEFELLERLIPLVDINQEIDNGRSLLHYAAEHGQLEIVKAILEKVEDINKKDENDDTPFALAIKNNHLDIVKIMIDKVEEINPNLAGMYANFKFLSCHVHFLSICLGPHS